MVVTTVGKYLQLMPAGDLPLVSPADVTGTNAVG